MAGNSADAGRSVTSKVIAILLVFTDGNVYSLTEIARLTGLPISTTYRLATEMATWGMLERAEDGQYRVGTQLRVIASRPAPLPSSLHERARRVLEDLSVAAPRSVARFGVLDGVDVAYLDKPDATHPVSMVFETQTLPAHATAMGKALLAFAAPHLVDEVIARGLPRYTPFTITSPDRLRRALSTIRLTRVAVCRRELELDGSAVAVPVFAAGGAVVAALELSVHDSRDFRLVQAPLVVAARGLSRELYTAQAKGQLTLGVDRHLSVWVNGHVPAVTPAATTAPEYRRGYRSAPDAGSRRPGYGAAQSRPWRSR
jgi:DNA-binding IclR family transcriptional regulator